MSNPCRTRFAPWFLSLALAALSRANAATMVWTNTAGGNWSAATNWSPNAVPASGDTVFITNAGSYAVAIDVSPTLASLSAGNANGGAITLNLPSTTLTLNGASILETNVVFNLSGGTL